MSQDIADARTHGLWVRALSFGRGSGGRPQGAVWVLLPLVRVVSRLPAPVGRGWAALLNAATGRCPCRAPREGSPWWAAPVSAGQCRPAAAAPASVAAGRAGAAR